MQKDSVSPFVKEILHGLMFNKRGSSIEVGKYTASLGLAYKIAHHFNLTIEEVFDFSEIENEE